MSTLAYIKNFLKDRDVASVTPSSPFLVKRVCRWIDFDADQVIVEYGPGTGVFSEHIVEHMTPGSRLVLIESNEAFVRKLRALFAADPRVTVACARAEAVRTVLREAGLDGADTVLSGIPFSFLDDAVRRDLLVTTREVLHPGGAFLVYQVYNHLEEPLRRHFASVEKKFELLNLPPMFTYRARPHPGGDGAMGAA
jgi:phospholipid N-methyltransferase